MICFSGSTALAVKIIGSGEKPKIENQQYYISADKNKSSDNENYFLVRAFDYSENVWKWYGSYDNSGKIIISKYSNGIFSGTFSGKLRTEDGKSEIEINDGRFDFNLFTLPTQTFP